MENPGRRTFLKNLGAASAAGAAGFLGSTAEKTINTPTMPEADTGYRAFLEAVEKGDKSVMQVAIGQVQAYNDELNQHNQYISYLESMLAQSAPDVRALIEISLKNYRVRTEFIKSSIQALSDPIREYLNKNPDAKPIPNPGIDIEKPRVVHS